MARKPISYLAGSVLLGTAIGAVVGLLAAPKSGAELRKTLREGAEGARKLSDELRQKVEEAGKTIPDRMAKFPNAGLSRFGGFRGEKHDDRADGNTHVTVEGEHAGDVPPQS